MIKVVAPVVAGVVPRQVHLAPLAVNAYDVPGMTVSLNVPVRDAAALRSFA